MNPFSYSNSNRDERKRSKVDLSLHISKLEFYHNTQRNLIVKYQIYESQMGRGHARDTIYQANLQREFVEIQSSIFSVLADMSNLVRECTDSFIHTEERDVLILLDILFDGVLDEFSTLLIINSLVFLIKLHPDEYFSTLIQKFLHFNFQSEAVNFGTHNHNRNRRRESRISREINAYILFNKLLQVQKEYFIPHISTLWGISLDLLKGLADLPNEIEIPQILTHEILSFLYNLVKLSIDRIHIQNNGNRINRDQNLQNQFTNYNFSNNEFLGNNSLNTFDNTNDKENSIILQLDNFLKKSFYLKDKETQILYYKICKKILKKIPHVSLLIQTIFNTLQYQFLTLGEWKNFQHLYYNSNYYEEIKDHLFENRSLYSNFIQTTEKQIYQTQCFLLIKSFYIAIDNVSKTSIIQKQSTKFTDNFYEGLSCFFSKFSAIIPTFQQLYLNMSFNTYCNINSYSDYFFKIFFGIFGTHDSTLIEILYDLLQIYIIIYNPDNDHILQLIKIQFKGNDKNFVNIDLKINSQESMLQDQTPMEEIRQNFYQADFEFDELNYSPTKFFFHFIMYIGFKVEVLYDFLISTETCFLEYLLLFCKWWKGYEKTGLDTQEFKIINNTLYNLRNMIQDSYQQNAFPFKPKALLKHFPETIIP